MSAAEDLPTVDGRRARRDRNRERVVDALLEIFREGDMTPSLDVVAERSGVSHRSVFRYFEDLDELHRVAVERHFASIEPFLALPQPAADDAAGRVEQLVAHRLDLYGRAAPVARVARMLAPRSDVLAENLAHNRSQLRKQTRAQLRPELEAVEPGQRDAVTHAITALLSFESIETMRHHQGLSRSVVHRSLTEGVRRLLDLPH